MAFTRKTKTESPAPQETFWDGAGEHEQKVGEQIARLEQRHRTLVEETAQELETLKKQLSDGHGLREKVAEVRQPLLQEISTLRNSIE